MNDITRDLVTVFFGNQTAGFALEFFEPDSLFVDLPFGVAIRRARNTHADRARSPTPRQNNKTHAQRKILSAELRAITGFVSLLQHPILQLDIAKSSSVRVARGREMIEI